MPTLSEKLTAAKADLADRDGVLVAFSGGVDSSVVAAIAHDALGDDAVACTAKSETLPEAELADAKRVADEIGIRHEIAEFSELDDPNFVENDDERCYHCRTMRLGSMFEAAAELDIGVVCDGTNADDVSAGHRPGLRAVEELDAYSPLLQHDISKSEVREIAERYDLSVADKPAMACLSSRIPTGLEVTEERLSRIEHAETLLRQWGFTQFRVRDHDGLARIEIGEDGTVAGAGRGVRSRRPRPLHGPRFRPRHARLARLSDWKCESGKRCSLGDWRVNIEERTRERCPSGNESRHTRTADRGRVQCRLGD